MTMFKYLILFSSALCLSVNGLSQTYPGKDAAIAKFGEILTFINSQYVDTVNPEKLTDEAIIAMLEHLDPHTSYITRDEVEEANRSITGSFVGIGIRFQILKDTLRVVATIPGGPSEKLGIMPGDRIVSIENNNVAGIGLKNSQVREKLMGDPGSKVKLDILRKKESKPLSFIITRDHIPINSVDVAYMVTPETGYIKLNSFSYSTAEEVQKSLKNLKAQGMKNLIFDLQGNGGGLLDAAQKVVDEFLSDNKLIVYSQGRSQPRRDLKAYRKGSWEDGKLILLTDETSASASEIVSGAIQDWDRGLIVGRRTYGKGLVQHPINLSDGSQLRLTVARYYTPSGRFIQKSYKNMDDYDNDLINRYKNGEYMHADSIHFNDSLKFYTLNEKRTVYGGGGIMPDIFVPLDTTEITDFYKDLSRSGAFNTFTLDYVEKNREKLAAEFATFADFKEKFEISPKLLKEFYEFAQKENSELKIDEKEEKMSLHLIKLRLKAMIADDLFDNSAFYQIYNDSNESLQRALKALENGEYETIIK